MTLSESREDAASALPTRRSLRKAGRLRERGVAPATGPVGAERVSRTAATEPTARVEAAVSPAASGRVADAVPDAVPGAGSVAAGAPVSASGTAPAAGSPAAAAVRTRIRRLSWVPRVAVLGALAAVTTVVPLSGMTAPQPPAPLPTFGTSSALDVLTGESITGTDAFDATTALAADPMASARAAVAAGRSQDRGPQQCGSYSAEANGSQAATLSSIEPAEVMMPLAPDSYRITSQYGYRWGGRHEGLDMAAPTGTPIHAVADGVVEYVGFGLGGRSGMIMVLKHEIDGQELRTWYVHSYPDGVFVDVGQEVQAGDVIGEVGSYGNSTGPHLHLEVHLDDAFTTVDPAVWLDQIGAQPLTPEVIACADAS